ncbi:MAG: MFS transporter [Thermoleophilia bacterium]|nr:MFS transporter [Thermoleophilia bacterium]
MRYPYSDILGAPSVGRLIAASIVGRMPVGMGALALFLFVRGAGGSYAIAGLAVSLATIGTSFGSPILGRLIDRQGQTRVLAVSMLSQVTALIALALLAPAGGFLLFSLCLVYGFSNPPLAASMRAGWSTLFTERSQLARAFSLDSTAQEVIWILGPLLAAALATSIDPRAPLIAMVAFSLIGVAWFATSQESREWRSAHRGERHLLGPLTAGPVRRVLAAILGLAFAWGVIELAIAAYADSMQHSAGPLLAVWAVGSVLGGLLFALRDWPQTPQRLLGILLFLNLVGFFVLLLAQTPWQLGVLLALTGVVNAPVIATLYVLIESLAPEGTVTEAFTWISTTFTVGIGAGAASAGILSDLLEPRAAFWLAVFGGGGAVLAVILRPRGLHPTVHQQERSARTS